MNMNARILDEHHRLDAWPADGAEGPAQAAEPTDPTAGALAAITSRYEVARARIISAVPATAAGRGSAPGEPGAGSAGWLPTVPVDLGTGLPAPRPLRARPDAAPVRSARSSRRRGTELVRALMTRLVTDLGVIPPGTSGWDLDPLPPVGSAMGPI